MSRTWPGRLLLLMAWSGGAVWPVQAIDFRLTTIHVQEDGFEREHSSFAYAADTAVLIDLPRGWDAVSDPDALTLTSRLLPQAGLRLEKSTLGPGAPFAGAGLDVYRRRLLAAVPAGAVHVRITAETAEPFPLFGWKDYELVADYEFYGQGFRRSALFINVNAAEQLCLNVVSPDGTFAAAHQAGLDLLSSWDPVPAKMTPARPGT
jgi:hypothetical protein